jgi:membrane-associated phospholipid phosphatase
VNALARIISFIFHPLLMATYLLILMALTLPAALDPLKPEKFLTFIILIFIVTFVLPVLNLGIFRVFGTIDSFTLKERKQRILPFLFISVIYVSITYVFYSKYRFGLNDNILRIMIIMDLLVLVATLVTFFFKVSVHSMGIWGLVGIALLLTKISEVNTLFYATIGLILLAGVVMASRLQLDAHTPREVIWGGVLGLATSMAGMLILF